MSTLDDSAVGQKGRLRPTTNHWSELVPRHRMLAAIVGVLLKWRTKRMLRGLSAAQLADAGIPEEYADRRGPAGENAAVIANLEALR